MSASIIVEQESGTWTGRAHPHNGYYAGDFSVRRTDDRPAGARHEATRHHLAPPAPVTA